MRFDEDGVRRALEARSGEPSPEYRARVRHAIANAGPGRALGWTPVIAVIVVTLLTAGSVGVLVASRHGRPGPIASAPRVTSPSPSASPTAASNVQLSAPSANVVWALVDYRALFRSTDRGDHWEKRSLPPNFGVRPSVTFINADEGWLLAPGSPTSQCRQAGAAVYHTTDGAATWSQVQFVAGLDPAQCKEVIYFADAGHGFITAWDDNHQPSVYWSNDGGVGWKKFTLSDPPDFKTLPGGFALRVEWIKKVGDTYYLEASGEQGAGTPYPDAPHRQYIFTSNDGAKWAWKQKVGSRVLAIVTPSRWLQLDGPGQLSESVNGGQASSPYSSNLAPDTPLDGTTIVFGDAETGYVVSRGAVQRTVDGGAHWALIATPWVGAQIHPPSPSPSPSPSASPIPMPASAYLSAPSANVVWALIGGARLFVSSDAGQTWQERTMPDTPAGRVGTEISFVDDADGWLNTCAGGGTLLWRTTDGAHTWQAVSSPFPPGECLYGLSFVDRSRGYITERADSSPPLMYWTPDGGETWNGGRIQNPPGFQAGQPGYGFTALRIVRLGGVYYLAADGTVPAGDVGWVFRSTDGVTFTYLASTPYPADSLGFVTSNRWLELSAPGQSVETLDSGKSWHLLTSEYSQAAPVAPQVVFGDAQVGYASVRGSIQRTTDGGVHWKAIKTPGTSQPG